MEYQFPPEVDSLVRSQMATGRYATEDELLKDALLTLSEREATLADIRAGIADMEAGRMRPLDDVVDEIRSKHGFAAP
jgi:antitoxin ParD1/3/4